MPTPSAFEQLAEAILQASDAVWLQERRKQSQENNQERLASVMLELIETGRATTVQAAKKLLQITHASQMTRILSALEKKGWITRSANSNDKRVSNLTLTPQGTEAVRRRTAERIRVLLPLLEKVPTGPRGYPLVRDFLMTFTEAQREHTG